MQLSTKPLPNNRILLQNQGLTPLRLGNPGSATVNIFIFYKNIILFFFAMFLRSALCERIECNTCPTRITFVNIIGFVNHVQKVGISTSYPFWKDINYDPSPYFTSVANGLFPLPDSDTDSCTMQDFSIGSDSDSDPLVEVYEMGTEICPWDGDPSLKWVQ